MSDEHIELHRSTLCLWLETCYSMDWVAYACISDICYQGFGLGSVYHVSKDWKCSWCQMTLWSDEDRIREKPDSLTQVFFVLLASDACYKPQLNVEKEVRGDVRTRTETING